MKRIANIINIVLIPICFLFIFSSVVKLLSLTSLYNNIFNNALCAVIVFLSTAIIALRLTPLLYKEVLSWRLPLKEWLRLHHLK